MGFWNSLFRSSPVNDAAVNNITFPGVPGSMDAMDPPNFSEEFASELSADINTNTDDSYSEYGVSLKETNNIFRLTYDGILSRDGAQDVYAVVGSESNGSWQDIKYYPMQKTNGQAYEVLFPASGTGNINVAFKDGADHWDNNSGRNYTYVNEG